MDEEIRSFLLHHMQAVQENDLAAYRETTAEDLTLYEWWVTPQRVEGLPFHEFMMIANARLGTVFGAETKGQQATSRLDLANLARQVAWFKAQKLIDADAEASAMVDEALATGR